MLISAVPERGDAEGEGAGGPGGWGVQEAGGRGQQGGGGKEVSRKYGDTSEKPFTGEYQKVPSTFDVKWPLVPFVAIICPKSQFVSTFGKLCVCMRHVGL